MPKGKTKKKFKITRIIPYIIGVIVLSVILVSLMFFPFNKKVFTNIYLAGVHAGGKNTEELQDEDILPALPDKITLTVGETNYQLDTNVLNIRYDKEKSILRAYNYSLSGNFIYDLTTRIFLLRKPVNIGYYLDYDRDALEKRLLEISDSVGQPPQYPSVSIKDGVAVVNPGKNGVEVDVIKTKYLLGGKISLGDFSDFDVELKEINVSLKSDEVDKYQKRAQMLVNKKITLVSSDRTFSLEGNDFLSLLDPKDGIDKEKLDEYIVGITQQVNKDSQNSVFVVDGGVVSEFIPSRDGVTVIYDSLFEKVTKTIDDILLGSETELTITIPVSVTPAKIRNEDVNNLGINTLVGKGVSYFRGSITNRIYNINLASSKFKGVLVAPGEEFSFNNILGDVSSLTGYKQAYVIKDGKTILGDGGGVCQVSTTLFRAVLNAGLPITQRSAHSYRVGYYEQLSSPGLDATVYSPSADLKFINDTPGHLLIQPIFDSAGYSLIFEIYGTSDGRVSSVSKPVITSSTPPPEDLYVDDPTLPSGTIKQIEYKAWGARVVFNYKVTRGQEVLTEKTFVSNYRPWGAVYLRGTF